MRSELPPLQEARPRREDPIAAVIGAGPAGLAAAQALVAAGIPTIVLEQGQPHWRRRHDCAADLPQGVGGLGLFSDGKFSYYPANSTVYRLRHTEEMRAAYGWMASQLEAVGIPVEAIPENLGSHLSGADHYDRHSMSNMLRKRYPSHSSNLQCRRNLIDLLATSLQSSIVTSCFVRAVHPRSQGYEIVAVENGVPRTWSVKVLVLATGRFGSLALHQNNVSSPVALRPLRYEIGIRIELPIDQDIFRTSDLDVKLIWTTDACSVRTFCTCRRGEVWNIPYQQMSALSGRADGPKTDFMNFAVLLRFEEQDLSSGQRVWGTLRDQLLGRRIAIWEPLPEFLGIRARSGGLTESSQRPWHPRGSFQRGSLRSLLGDEVYELLAQATTQLFAGTPQTLRNLTACLFPAVESTGFYPDLDNDLRVSDESIWCAGDVAGKFRGIVAALISGYYSGGRAANWLQRHPETRWSKLRQCLATYST